MNLDFQSCFQALAARDPRFDGLFFVGVKSTGIYCRPVCTAKTPGSRQCRFFTAAAQAEQAGFRPCLRCRPELAPGNAPIDRPRTEAQLAALRIEAGALNNDGDLEVLAAELGLSSRQLRRAIVSEYGVSPIQLAQTQRLLLAKRLIAETTLPLTQIAFAAGFSSIRRFNDLFQKHYRLTPSTLRRGSVKANDQATFRLALAYRPPLGWRALLDFLAVRAIPGVELVQNLSYLRTVAIGDSRGWLRVSPVADRTVLLVELPTDLVAVLPEVLTRLRQLFDLDARPDMIAAHLRTDRKLSKSIKQEPGLRLPGSFDPFELGVRAILGQQVTVRGASTLAGRLVERFGETIETPWPELNRLTPSAVILAKASAASLATIGLPAARAETLHRFAQAVARGEIAFHLGSDPQPMLARLQTLPGIGPWTAEYIAMRALHWPDALPASDLGLLKACGCKSARELQRAAEAWRPWRSYAAMHLWQQFSKQKNKPRAKTGA
jgi:AraC family transcriptional regulator of adaptative response / DNA-3-methyladenine glycosylase II